MIDLILLTHHDEAFRGVFRGPCSMILSDIV